MPPNRMDTLKAINRSEKWVFMVKQEERTGGVLLRCEGGCSHPITVWLHRSTQELTRHASLSMHGERWRGSREREIRYDELPHRVILALII